MLMVGGAELGRGGAQTSTELLLLTALGWGAEGLALAGDSVVAAGDSAGDPVGDQVPWLWSSHLGAFGTSFPKAICASRYLLHHRHAIPIYTSQGAHAA